jgi:hypothetical protein
MEDNVNDKHFMFVRVISRDLINDVKAQMQNLFGARLTPYESMIQKGKIELWKEVTNKNLKVLWYRYDITFMAKGAITIILYGDAE